MEEMEVTSPGGTKWRLKRNENNPSGDCILGVQRRKAGQYHAKVKVDGMTDGQQFVPGKFCKTAQEAGLRYAKYMANPYPIVKKDPDRAEKGHGKACAACSPSHSRLTHCCTRAHL